MGCWGGVHSLFCLPPCQGTRALCPWLPHCGTGPCPAQSTQGFGTFIVGGLGLEGTSKITQGFKDLHCERVWVGSDL